jgi:hypothetical protein
MKAQSALTDEPESGRGVPFGGASSIGPQEISEAAEIDKAQEISFKFKHVVECRSHLTLGAGVGRGKSRTRRGAWLGLSPGV